MEYIKLKNSDLKVSRLCMGCCPMGGYGWGTVSEQDLIETVHAALDSGVVFFDTADIYGLGKSEEILGKALKGHRDNAVIASKFGVQIKNGKTFYNNSKEWINSSIKASLKRLQTDYIDLYQIHYRDNKTKIEEILEVLEKLKEKGYIRYYGLSNINMDDIEDIKAHTGKFSSFQNEYSLACRKNEKNIFVLSDLLQITPLTWGSLGQGVLTGKYDINSVFESNDRRSRDIYVNFYGEKLRHNLQIVERIKAISLQNRRSISSIAIRFILDYIKESIVLVGIKNPKQLMSNVESMDWRLTDKQINDLLDISDTRRHISVDKRATGLENPTPLY